MTDKTQKKEIKKLRYEQTFRLMDDIQKVQKNPSLEPRQQKQKLGELIRQNTTLFRFAFKISAFQFQLPFRYHLLFAVFIYVVWKVMHRGVTHFIEIPDLFTYCVSFVLIYFVVSLAPGIKIWGPGFLLTIEGDRFVSIVEDLTKKQLGSG